MRIAVAPSNSALADLHGLLPPDVLVLWERIGQHEASEIARANPWSYTVSGEWRNKQIWGVIRKGTQTILEYRKIMADDQCAGYPDGRQQSTIIWDEQRKLAICVLVCRDVDVAGFTQQTLTCLAAAPCTHRILAIPAHMSSDWFGDATLSERYCGFTVALSNGRSGPGAVPSFISNRVDGVRDGFTATMSGLISAELPYDHETIPIDSVMHRFTSSVRHAPFRWAPEAAANLAAECDRMAITMGFTDGGFYPCVDLEKRRIEIPVYYLENLWCVCFAGVAFSVHMRSRLAEMGTVIQLPDDGDVGAARVLLQWAFERAVNADQMPWPDALRPDIEAAIGTTMNTANVLFEIAVGFVLHHEFAHIIHDLRVDSTDPYQRRFDESLADQIAAAAYVTQAETDPKKQESRCLGIALAFLEMVGTTIFTVDCLRKNGERIPNEIRGIGEADHPSSISRLRTFMDDAYFAGMGNCHEICQVMLRAFCTRLQIGGVALDVPSLEAGWRMDLNLLEVHVMQD